MKVFEGIELIDHTMANCYHVELNGMDILIDAGTKKSGRRIIEYFNRINKRPEIVLITHFHMDHLGGLNEIYAKFKPDIYVPMLEVKIINGTEKPRARNLVQKLIYSMAPVNHMSSIKPAYNMKIDDLEYYETPGHTVGSTSYFLVSKNIIFSGDAIINRNGKPDINRTFTWNVEDAENSVKRIMDMKPSLILPGHGEPLKL